MNINKRFSQMKCIFFSQFCVLKILVYIMHVVMNDIPVVRDCVLAPALAAPPEIPPPIGTIGTGSEKIYIRIYERSR